MAWFRSFADGAARGQVSGNLIGGEHASVAGIRQPLPQVTHEFTVRQDFDRLAEPVELSPYGKWLGAAFGRLPEAAAIAPSLRAAVTADAWSARERHLSGAFTAVAARHNALGLTGPLDPRTRPYFDRPYQVIGAGRFEGALRAAIADPRIRVLGPAGAVDQVTAVGGPPS
jgi:hypothetical protein